MKKDTLTFNLILVVLTMFICRPQNYLKYNLRPEITASYRGAHTYTVKNRKKRKKDQQLKKWFSYSEVKRVNPTKTQFWKFGQKTKFPQPHIENRKLKLVSEFVENFA